MLALGLLAAASSPPVAPAPSASSAVSPPAAPFAWSVHSGRRGARHRGAHLRHRETRKIRIREQVFQIVFGRGRGLAVRVVHQRQRRLVPIGTSRSRRVRFVECGVRFGLAPLGIVFRARQRHLVVDPGVIGQVGGAGVVGQVGGTGVVGQVRGDILLVQRAAVGRFEDRLLQSRGLLARVGLAIGRAFDGLRYGRDGVLVGNAVVHLRLAGVCVWVALGTTAFGRAERLLAPARQVRLEIIRPDEIFDVQERGTLEPDIDEGGLQARKDTSHLPQVDVADGAAARMGAAALDVKLGNDAVFDERDPRLG